VSGTLSPQGARTSEKRSHDRFVARDSAAVKEPELGAQVGSGNLEDLGRAAYGVVEPNPLVPHGVPHSVSQCLDVAVRLVDENDVEVAVGAKLAASVSADSDQGYAARVVTRGSQQKLSHPLVGGSGERAAESVTLQV